MPRTAATPAAGSWQSPAAAAALAGAGTAAAASASAAAIPASGPAITTTATTTTATTATAIPSQPVGHRPPPRPHHRRRPQPARPRHHRRHPRHPRHRHPRHRRHGTAVGTHGTAVTTTADKARGHTPAARTPARHHTAPAAPARPYQMYDSVTPSAIPGGKAIATYADGPYAASPATVTGHNVTWIDTNGTDPAGATVLDVEPGDATPAGAATWAAQRLNTHPHATAVIYTMRSEWAAAQTSVAALPAWQQHHIRWWIADPTGVPHLVPGSDATQWYWGTHYDISTVNPGF